MSQTRRQYPFHLIESKWQQVWEQQQTFRAWNPGEPIPADHPFAQRHSPGSNGLPPKFYILDMFPYPSGAGLHVGHPEGYTATDILARYHRARGFHVLHPMGWDAFGLPAEQFAVKTGQHPRKATEANIANFKRQIRSLGFSYDWSREVDTTDPGYFKWTQWIFLQLYHAWFNPATNRAESMETLAYPPELKTLEEKRAYADARRLAYVAEMPVWWCEQLGTVLANEEVIDGKSDVGDFPVVRKPMRQWMLRITAYAERLLQDLDTIDWSHSLKEMQRNWIGRSEGADVTFPIAECGTRTREIEPGITVFTTRPDTLFGATYMVLAPEHKLVDALTTDGQRKTVEAYREHAATKSDLERTELAKEKTGVFTGACAINPVSQERIPIWIADYVLASYGTGAIMAVPAHDTRDLEFAQKFHLPVRIVVQAPAGKDSIGYVDDGVSVNSGLITGLPTPEAKRTITAWLEAHGVGRRMVNYKLRDWLFSRQRYWGEPFPIVWKRDAHGQLYHQALPESALPVMPPELTDYKPTASGEPPLARALAWVNLPDGSMRETNTMPQWAGSCWYYLRYLDARNRSAFCGTDAERYWMGATTAEALNRGSGKALKCGSGEAAATPSASTLQPFNPSTLQPFNPSTLQPFNPSTLQPFNPSTLQPFNPSTLLPPLPATRTGVDLYVGGTEHAVLHLLYARFWHKVLFDLGHVSTAEPFFKLVNQGLILGEDGQKMSKSRGNVINPDDILQDYGADALRLYEMFMGPLEMVKPWNTKGVEGVYRFLGRVWRLFVEEQSETEFEQGVTADPDRAGEWLDQIRLSPAIQDMGATPAQLKALHACIKKVTEDLDGMRFNTAISALMVFVNEAITWEHKPVKILREFLILLQPLAPHLAEELWAKLRASSTPPPAAGLPHHLALSYQPWPPYDPDLLVEDMLEIPVQVNGKLRDRIVVPATSTPAELEAIALACDKTKPFLAGKTIRKVIVVPGKLVNIVAA